MHTQVSASLVCPHFSPFGEEGSILLHLRNYAVERAAFGPGAYQRPSRRQGAPRMTLGATEEPTCLVLEHLPLPASLCGPHARHK